MMHTLGHSGLDRGVAIFQESRLELTVVLTSGAIFSSHH